MLVLGYVLIKTKPGTSREVTRCRTVRGVKLANDVFGRYDAVLVISAKNLDELSKTIYEAVEKLPNVVKTETLVSLFHPEATPKRPPKEPRPSVISFHCPSCNSLNEQDAKFCSFCGVEL